jgi:hypothetical protein
MIHCERFLALKLTGILFFLVAAARASSETRLPVFGQDTVLVWSIVNQDYTGSFVVRIAEFLPDRYFEWEDSTMQGTVFIPNSAVQGAKKFMSVRLFQGGVETRGKDATILWLSQKAFRDLKSNGKTKLDVDELAEWLTLAGTDQLTIEVNKSPMILPVIKVAEERGTDRWFLDSEDNPLLVKIAVRKYSETLSSIRTDQHGSLRWIKGKKLLNPH